MQHNLFLNSQMFLEALALSLGDTDSYRNIIEKKSNPNNICIKLVLLAFGHSANCSFPNHKTHLICQIASMLLLPVVVSMICIKQMTHRIDTSTRVYKLCVLRLVESRSCTAGKQSIRPSLSISPKLVEEASPLLVFAPCPSKPFHSWKVMNPKEEL